jgi:hypothetical protein
VTGFVPPGGSISSGANPDAKHNVVATFTLPNTGPGAVITLSTEPGGNFCNGPCRGLAQVISSFSGYTDPEKSPELTVTWDKSVVKRGLDSEVFKTQEPPTKGTLIDECGDDPRWKGPELQIHQALKAMRRGPHSDTADRSPCIDDREITRRGDLRFEILLLSGDPGMRFR